MSQEPKHEIKSDASSDADQQLAPEVESQPNEQEQQNSDVDQHMHQEPQSTSSLPEQQQVHFEAVAMASKVEGNQRTQDVAIHSVCLAGEGVSVGTADGATLRVLLHSTSLQHVPFGSSTLTEQEAVDTTLDVPQRMDIQTVDSPQGQHQPTQYSISLRNSNMHSSSSDCTKGTHAAEQQCPNNSSASLLRTVFRLLRWEHRGQDFTRCALRGYEALLR